MNDIKDYIANNKDRFLKELFSLLRIKSISSQEVHKKDMIECANRWKEILLDIGIGNCQVMESDGNPIVFGEKIVDPSFKTVLVYGHYDVMPVDPLELWKTDPFEPEIIDGKIYGRGADDDKGQSFMHAKALEYLIKTNLLKCNVKLLLEGEEEIGSGSLYPFCKKHKNLLKADIILVSDTSMIASNIPSITVGLRGLSYLEVEITGPNKDLHSGIFGGAVANPINVLCKMIGSLTNDKNEIIIPGFYDDVIASFSECERKLMLENTFNESEYKTNLGIEDLYGEEGYSTIERTSIRPTLDVCGIFGGYTEKGTKTVLPSTASAKISMRLVPNQNSNKISDLFSKYFISIAPKGVKVTVKPSHGGEPYILPVTMPAYKAAEQAYIKVFGKQPVPTRSGGSIPIIAGFEEILGIKSILMGFGLQEDAIHSFNESYRLENFYKGIETIIWFYHYYS